MSFTGFRDYQDEAIGDIHRYFHRAEGHPLVLMPGGTGKSVVIGGFLWQALHYYPHTRALVLTHVQELIEQDLEKLLWMWPTAPAGVFSSGLNRKEWEYPIIFGSIQSVAKKIHLLGKRDVLLIDEAHLVSPKQETMYRYVIQELLKINPKLKVIGFSATGYRLGLGSLVGGGIFTDVAHDSTGLERFNRYISDGWLSMLVPKRTDYEISVDDVDIVGGEYVQSQLQAAVDKHSITRAALEETIDKGRNRKRWIVFASGVHHAEHVSEMLDQMGVTNVCVHSKIDRKERKPRIEAYKAGLVQCIVNNNILTTGFDCPEIDMIVMLRHTLSTALWVQMLSRGTRIAPWVQKNDCLCLDFAGNTRRLGPINDPVLPSRPGVKRNGGPPVKVCEACGTYCHTSVRFCPSCGYEFPREVHLNARADSLELVRGHRPDPEEERQIEEVGVDRVSYRKHTRRGGRSSLEVLYYCGIQRFREFICFEHGGTARHWAETWWHERTGGALQAPSTVDQALGAASKVLRIPVRLRVVVNQKYPEIIGYRYA